MSHNVIKHMCTTILVSKDTSPVTTKYCTVLYCTFLYTVWIFLCLLKESK